MEASSRKNFELYALCLADSQLLLPLTVPNKSSMMLKEMWELENSAWRVSRCGLVLMRILDNIFYFRGTF